MGNNTLACIAYGSVVCLHPLVHPLVVINFVQGQSEKDLSRIELLHVAFQVYPLEQRRSGLSDADAPCWVKTEQEESIFAVNSLEYSMSLLFSRFLH